MRNWFLFLGIMALVGCYETHRTAGELVKWVEDPDNGLRREKTINEFGIMAQYKPLSYIICNEAKGITLTPDEYAKREAELSGLEYFQVRLKSANPDPLLSGGGDQNIYHQRNNFLMFGQKDYVYLLRGEDTAYCAMYHFVNYQGLAPYADILLAFKSDTTESSSDRELVYDDQVFGLGPVHFTFTDNEIASVPQLELK